MQQTKQPLKMVVTTAAHVSASTEMAVTNEPLKIPMTRAAHVSASTEMTVGATGQVAPQLPLCMSPSSYFQGYKDPFC